MTAHGRQLARIRPDPPPDPHATDGPMVVLLQSDDDSREMYAQYFTHLGWRPVTVTNGPDALAAAPGARVIVTDIPRGGHGDAFALIRDLKRARRTKHIPIAVVTAWATTTARERAEQSGCDVFLLKPCLPDDLLDVLVRLIACRHRGIGRSRVDTTTLPAPDHTRRNTRQNVPSGSGTWLART